MIFQVSVRAPNGGKRSMLPELTNGIKALAVKTTGEDALAVCCGHCIYIRVYFGVNAFGGEATYLFLDDIPAGKPKSIACLFWG